MDTVHTSRLTAFLVALRRSGFHATADSVDAYSLRYPAAGPLQAVGNYYPFPREDTCTVAIVSVAHHNAFRIDTYSFADWELSVIAAADAVVCFFTEITRSVTASAFEALDIAYSLFFPTRITPLNGSI